MSGRVLAFTALAALTLGGCSSGDVIRGAPVSDTRPPPCAIAPSAAPASAAPASASAPSASSSATSRCGPSPDPASSSVSSATSAIAGDPSLFSAYARQTFTTRLGDPGLLNVCKIAGQANLAAARATLDPPARAAAGSCSLAVDGSGIPAGSSLVISTLQAGPYLSPKPTMSTVSGVPVARYPYEADFGNCQRALVLTQPGLVTTVVISLFAKGLAATRACALSEAMLQPLVAVAAGTTPPSTLPTASPSLLSVDVCKVAAAANLAVLPDFAGTTPEPGNFGVDCRFETGSRDFTIVSGILRDATGVPDGTLETVDGHPLYGDLDGGGSCTVTSAQAEGETVSISTSAAQVATVPTCDAMAKALGRYLDVLKLR